MVNLPQLIRHRLGLLNNNPDCLQLGLQVHDLSPQTSGLFCGLCPSQANFLQGFYPVRGR
nr:MAG TPA: hypothetical protein [Microviridae sp.]